MPGGGVGAVGVVLAVVLVGAVGQAGVAGAVGAGQGVEVGVGGLQERVDAFAEVVGGGVCSGFPERECAGVHAPDFGELRACQAEVFALNTQVGS